MTQIKLRVMWHLWHGFGRIFALSLAQVVATKKEDNIETDNI